MMDEGFISELADRLAEPRVLGVDGKERVFLPEHWSEMSPRIPKPDPLQLGTLSGLVAYISANTDKLDLARCLIVIKDPCRVQLFGPLEDAEATEYRRPLYVVAVHQQNITWATYLLPEEFIVGLQSNFVPTPDSEMLLRLLGTIREGSVRETIDDGLKQEVKTQKGVSLVQQTTVPNPVTLQPYRTFHEIEQPTSKFVVRMRSTAPEGKPQIALFEAEGGAWERVAVSLISVFLYDELVRIAGRAPAGQEIKLPAIIA